jgi:hypothetical protein
LQAWFQCSNLYILYYKYIENSMTQLLAVRCTLATEALTFVIRLELWNVSS